MRILDFIFPKYCVNCKRVGDYICVNCFAFISFEGEGACAVCNKPSINWLTHPGCMGRYTIDGVFTSLSYKGIVKKLVARFKYKPYLSDLEHVLVDLLFEGIIQEEEFIKTQEERPIISFIPLHSSKLKSRGYNQSEILAKSLSKKLNLKIHGLLKRVKKTSSQVGLTREKRIENLKGSFSIAPNVLISQYPNILLVDDVFTTGSTLLEAANVLKRKGAKKIWGVTLSRG